MTAALIAFGIGALVLIGGILIGLAVAEICDATDRAIEPDTDHEMINRKVP